MTPCKILVVGGAGFIGSHMVKALLAGGHAVTTLDDLSTGYLDAIIGGEFVHGSLTNRALVDELFARGNFDAVMHFASYIQVGESVTDPAKYYHNNVSASLGLLEAMVRRGVKRFVFSSSAAVYGNCAEAPLAEIALKAPINPYGRTKWMVEQALADFDQAYDLRSVSLRYFNAAGADPDGQLGERHEPETHLIPLILQAASGRRGEIKVFGRDYPTPDGTCVRDYIHVVDLCDAHALALCYLLDGGPTTAFNVGNGAGYSVQQVIDVVRQVTRREFRVVDAPRRLGDPAVLVADSSLARNQLGWRPRFEALDTLVAHAWAWERGFSGRLAVSA